MLQVNRHSSVSQQHRQQAPGDFDDHPVAACTGMVDVELPCSQDQCTVLATNMRGRNCNDYCTRNSRTCVAAWEEVDETCGKQTALRCDQVYGWTSDLLCQCSTEQIPSRGAPPDASDLTLVWSDEFEGDQVDRSKWDFVTGGGGWGNQELQYYTSRPANARVRDGKLTIQARCEEYGGDHFTSAKLHTKGLADWGPGHRVDVRARLPTGKGTWPAIWMLPTDNAYGRWPRSGEIDIMEAVGCTSSKVYGTVHTLAYNHMKHTEKYNSLRADVGAWHTYSIVWEAERIRWYVDGHHYHTFDPSSHSSDKWPFSQRFHLILNLAVGGSWGGKCLHGLPSCHASGEFGTDQVMEVDYARVYRL